MNIYTVKWGTKYNASHVNQLYESCLENLSMDFTFHCLTEDSKDIDSNIKILSLPGGNKLEKWWNKMYLFDETIVTQKGEKMFFDLDTILQKNIDDIANFDAEDCLCFVKTWWHDLDTQYKDTRHVPHKFTDLNSSVLRWNDSLNSNEIIEYFNEYQNQILWYYRGLDNFFYNRRITIINVFS